MSLLALFRVASPVRYYLEGDGGALITSVKDGIDRAALNAELKSIVKSGILDLGVLGLWERDLEDIKSEISSKIPR